MGKLKSYQEQIQEIIEKGINSVEEQYKTVSEKPFELAERLESEARSYSVKNVRSRHDEYMNSFYSSLRSLNKRLGDYAGDLIARVEKEVVEEVGETAEKVEEKAPASKAATATKTTTRKTTAKKGAQATA